MISREKTSCPSCSDAGLPHSLPMQTINTLFWEMGRNINEFSTPVRIDEGYLDNLEQSLLQSEMRDIMLAHIKTLGHKDKYPRQYDWENILPTLQAGEELLWIVSKCAHKQSFDLYVGLKFNQMELNSLQQLKVREERFQIFCDSFSRRLFPESILEKIKILNKNPSVENCSSQITVHSLLKSLHEYNDNGNRKLDNIFFIMGMPSVKDMDTDKVISERKEEARPFSSLNDILEPHININSPFTIVFSISPSTSEDIRDSLRRKFSLRDQIKPFLEREINQSHSITFGTGQSSTPGHTTENISETQQEKSNLLYSIGRGIFGTHIRPFGKDDWQMESDKSKTTSINIVPDVLTTSSHQDTNESKAETVHISRSDLIFIDKNIDRSLAHLQQAIGAGGYFATTTVYTDKQEIGESISRTIRSAFSGVHSYLRPMQIFRLNTKNFFQLRYNIPIANILTNLGFECEVLNRDSACLALLLPDTDLPDDIKLKKSVFYARPEEKKRDKTISMGPISYFENQFQNNINALQTRNLELAAKDIFSHMFVVGTPGSGKSARTTYILNNLPNDIRLVILETAKREYAENISRNGRHLVRYTLGNSQLYPLRINPFYFDPGTGLKQHIAVLADAIADLLPMEALIGPKLREAVERCYRRCGWDIETSSRIIDDEDDIKYPDMLMFNSEVLNICDTLKDYGPEVRSNYTGALKNRASIFLDDVYQDIFSFDGNKELNKLFPPDADVVIEMEDMPPSEINMPAFIISIILQRLRAFRFLEKEKGNLNDKFVIAIEEAHNVLSRKIEGGKNNEMQSGKGEHLLNQVVRLLAEGRGLGLGIIVIDQSAHAIAPSVLADTNTKVILRLEDGDEIKTIGTSIGLNEKDWSDLQHLGTGECIVKSKLTPMPVKLAPLPDQHQSNSIPVAIPDYTKKVPYIKCERMFDEIFASGLLSYASARKVARQFIDMCNYSQPDLLRYIWGKYLFINQRYVAFNKHIDWPQRARHIDSFIDYYSIAFMLFMSDNEADSFIKFIIGNNDCSYSKNTLTNGCLKLLSLIEEDSPDKRFLIEKLKFEFIPKIQTIRDVETSKSAIDYFANALKTLGLIDEWQRIAEHIVEPTFCTPSDTSIDSILLKYTWR